MIYHFDTADARAYGTDEAIMLYNIVGWLRLNKAERRNEFEGRTWTYNTARALESVFDGIWNEDQVRRLINKLVKAGVLLKGNYNAEVGRRRDDRTLWLALADESRITPKKAEAPASDRPEGQAPRPAEPPADSPDASGKSAECYKEQKETSNGKTAPEKRQQQPLLPPQLPFDDPPGGLGAAAADPLRLGPEEPEGLTSEGPTPEEHGARQVLAHTLHTLGVKGAEAQALVAGFPLEAIQRQIDWLPYQNCEKPGYWLPRYIREDWPKPKAVERQEAEAAERRDLAASGLTAAQKRQQEKEARQETARRRADYRESLPPAEAEALLAEADAAAMEIPFCRDTAHSHKQGKLAPSYRQMLGIEVDKIVDRRLQVRAEPPPDRQH